MTDNDSRRRFEELLPWHVNGTLAAAEREWVERYLREHPEAHAELRCEEGLRTYMRQDTPPPTPDAGLERFMARIHAEAGARARPAAAARPPGLADRVRAFLASWNLTPALAVAATVVVAQTAIIGGLLSTQGLDEPEFSTVRSLPPGQVVSGPVLQLSFRPDTSEAELRALIVGIGGTLVGGPGQLGNYLVAVPAGREDEVAQRLAGNPLVEDVSVLPRLPARE